MSKPAHNKEGNSEKKLREMYDNDRVWTCKLKKRHRKDLTIEEIKEIVAAAQEPFHLQKDIAQKYRISAQLVSILIQESIKKPEKLINQRNKEHLAERK